MYAEWAERQHEITLLVRARGRGGKGEREVERTTSCASPRLHLCPVGRGFGAVCGDFLKAGRVCRAGTAEAARRRHRGQWCPTAAGWESDWRRGTGCLSTRNSDRAKKR